MMNDINKRRRLTRQIAEFSDARLPERVLDPQLIFRRVPPKEARIEFGTSSQIVSLVAFQ